MRQIDPATGHTLASFSIGAGDLVAEGDLAFRSDGLGFLSTAGGAGVSLLSFNIGTLSSNTISAEPFLFDGLAFNSANTLYGMSQGGGGSLGDGTRSKLYTIDQSTGARTLIRSLNISAATNEILGGLTFRSDGSLWSEVSNGTTSTLARVNTATGNATFVGSITGFGNVSGIAFLGSTSVPEPNVVALTATGLIGLVGFAARKRRRN
jgi:hypothetical protein